MLAEYHGEDAKNVDWQDIPTNFLSCQVPFATDVHSAIGDREREILLPLPKYQLLPNESRTGFIFSIIVSPACARDGKKNEVHYNHKTE